MQFLVDANVLSEATKPEPMPAVLEWLADHEAILAVSPIILGELEYGILLLPDGKRRTRLLRWFSSGVKHLAVLAIDDGTARVWAQLLATLKRKGRAMPVKDSLIAATALQHKLVVATRNLADYRYCGVKVFNPFGYRR